MKCLDATYRLYLTNEMHIRIHWLIIDRTIVDLRKEQQQQIEMHIYTYIHSSLRLLEATHATTKKNEETNISRTYQLYVLICEVYMEPIKNY